MLDIGSTVLLHNVAYPQAMGKGSLPDRFVLVTIKESREVENDYGDGTGTGFRALGEDGRFYLSNWYSFPNCSSDPHWTWIREIPDEEIKEAIRLNDALWFNVLMGLPSIPFRPSWFNIYCEYIGYCDIHKILFDTKEICFYCQHRLKSRSHPEDFTWNGWR